MLLEGYTAKATKLDMSVAIRNVGMKLVAQKRMTQAQIWARIEEVSGKDMHENSLHDLTTANLVDILTEFSLKLYKR